MFFESFQRADIDNLEWSQKSKVLQIAKEKAGLRNNPDYIYPAYLLIIMSILIPILVLMGGLNYQTAATSFIILGWLFTYVTNKLAKPYMLPFLDEALSEFHEKSLLNTR